MPYANFRELPFRNCLENAQWASYRVSWWHEVPGSGLICPRLAALEGPVRNPHSLFQTVSPRRTVNKVVWMGRGCYAPALKVRSTIEWLPSPTSGPPLALAWGEEAGEREVRCDRPDLRVLEVEGGVARGQAVL